MGPRFLPGRAARRRLRARGAARSPARASQPRLPSSSHRTLLAPPRPTRAGRLPPTAPGIHSVTHQLHIGPTCTLGPSVSIGLCSAILDCHNGADTPHFQPLRPTVTALLCPVPDSALFRRHWATSDRGQTYTLHTQSSRPVQTRPRTRSFRLATRHRCRPCSWSPSRPPLRLRFDPGLRQFTRSRCALVSETASIHPLTCRNFVPSDAAASRSL